MRPPRPSPPHSERHLRRTVTEFVAHYHQKRNHQGIGNRLIVGTLVIDRAKPVRRKPV